nr:tetratricopeptide repeat protein [Candidatus Sigynarchaeota archaeon]
MTRQVFHIGRCLRAREQYDNAIAKLEEALGIMDENANIFDGKDRFEIMYEIGDILYLKKDWDRATKVFGDALSIARSASNPDQLKKAYHAIAFTLAKGGRKREAIECYEAELKIAEDTGMLEQQAFCWNEIGAVYSQLDDHKKALDCYTRELECYRRAGDAKNVTFSKRNMGNALWWLGDKNKAIDMYREVLAEAKESNYLDLVFETLDSLGGLFRQQRQFGDALAAYQEQFELATKEGNKQMIRQSYRGFGRVNLDMENYKVAIDFFSKEEQLCLELNDMVNRQDVLKYIGKTYGQAGRAQDGVDYYIQAADINKRLGNWDDVGQCYFSAAAVNRNAKLRDKAQEYYAQALGFFEKAGN